MYEIVKWTGRCILCRQRRPNIEDGFCSGTIVGPITLGNPNAISSFIFLIGHLPLFFGFFFFVFFLQFYLVWIGGGIG